MFWVWYGPTGKDMNGRFCRSGDPREKIATDHFGYCERDLKSGIFTVLGKVIIGMGPALPV